MDIPMLPSMLSMPSHCHRGLRLRCFKVPGSGCGIDLCFPNTIQILFSKLSTIFLIKRSSKDQPTSTCSN